MSIACGIGAAAQATTPDAALEEMVTADKPQVFEKHLPLAVQQALDQLSEQDKAEAMKKLFVPALLTRDGVKLQRNDDEGNWELVSNEGIVKARVALQNVFVTGTDALVLLKIQERHDWEQFIVGMRLEEDEWRVTELGSWENKSLESDELLREILPTARNEAAAQDFLRALYSALQRYSNLYVDVGFPRDLEALSGRGNGSASPEHAMLMQGTFTGNATTRAGYEFHYTLLDSGQPGHPGIYRIVARPLEFGKSGNKSFFIDQSGVVHATAEDRAATEFDPALR